MEEWSVGIPQKIRPVVTKASGARKSVYVHQLPIMSSRLSNYMFEKSGVVELALKLNDKIEIYRVEDDLGMGAIVCNGVEGWVHLEDLSEAGFWNHMEEDATMPLIPKDVEFTEEDKSWPEDGWEDEDDEDPFDSR
jgi:hypothetical protein